MRLIIAGGGTGGHLFPGLAVAREFQRRDRMTEILFVGTESGIESRVVPREGFPLETLAVKGLKGKGIRGLLQGLYGIPLSFLRSLRIINRFRPHCVIGLGGYASGPLVMAARVKGVRTVIMEQNLRPGLTNRILGSIVDRIFTAYAETAAYFSRDRVIESGNPVRWQTLPEVAKDNRFTLLVFGGSAGAHRINLCMVDALRHLTDLAPALRIVHQTGAADLVDVQSLYRPLPFEAEVVSFIERMDEVYAKADLVVCRSGAGTVAELTVFGKPAILVPYPYAADDHQRWNAQALARQGAAEMVLDGELNGEKLAAMIRSLVLDRSRLDLMSAAARKLGRPYAAEKIVDECYSLVQG